MVGLIDYMQMGKLCHNSVHKASKIILLNFREACYPIITDYNDDQKKGN